MSVASSLAGVADFQLMAMAGYDPRAALDLWELMSCVEEDAISQGQAISIENRFALLRTHPTSDVRQRALEKDLDKAMRLFREHAPRRREQVRKEMEKNGQVREAEAEKSTVPLKDEHQE